MDSLKKTSVLYVEDDLVTQEALSKYLRRFAGEVFVASCGEDGIEVYKDNLPDIVIADLLLPNMNGLEMISEIKKINPDCSVIITTTVSELDSVLMAVNLGIVQYIIKPIDTDELEDKLKSIAMDLYGRKKEKSVSISFSGIENKLILEDAVKKGFIGVLKEHSGKGPRDATVLISDNVIEISAFGTSTQMEKTMLRNKKNTQMVEKYREFFYESIEKELIKMAEEIVKQKLSLFKVEINFKVDCDKLFFLPNH